MISFSWKISIVNYNLKVINREKKWISTGNWKNSFQIAFHYKLRLNAFRMWTILKLGRFWQKNSVSSMIFSAQANQIRRSLNWLLVYKIWVELNDHFVVIVFAYFNHSFINHSTNSVCSVLIDVKLLFSSRMKLCIKQCHHFSFGVWACMRFFLVKSHYELWMQIKCLEFWLKGIISMESLHIDTRVFTVFSGLFVIDFFCLFVHFLIKNSIDVKSNCRTVPIELTYERWRWDANRRRFQLNNI